MNAMTTRTGMVASALVLFAWVWWWLGHVDSSSGAAGSDAAPPLPRGGGVAARRVDAAESAAVGQLARAAATHPMIRGRVVDELGDPVTGGTVTLRCLTDEEQVEQITGGVAQLGEDGSFRAAGCDARVCVELHHTSLFRSGDWVLTAGRPQTLPAQMFSRLEGTVVDPWGDPIPAVHVVAVPGPDGDPTAVPPFSATATTTDDDGKFFFVRLERPPCDSCTEAQGRCDEEGVLAVWAEVRVTARGEGYAVSEARIDPDHAEPIRISLARPAGPVEGTVVGELVGEASVLLRSDERPYEMHRADVAQGGAFRVEGLGSGDYTLRVLERRTEIGRVAGVRAGRRVRVSVRAPDEL